jgi:hypothetical protein
MDAHQTSAPPAVGVDRAVDTRHFYRDIGPFHRFVDGVFAPAVYQACWPAPAPAAVRHAQRGCPRARVELAVLARHLVHGLVFWFDLRPGSVDAERYRRDVVINADYRKVSGMLRLVVDCSEAQADDIERALEGLQRQDKLHFGLHRAQEAIMTCVRPNVDAHEHVHFLEGGDGGLYLAARKLKQRLAARSKAGHAARSRQGQS